MSDTPYDLVVIGGGPGGYVAAIRAAQLGMKVACVEGRGALGGTCLNVGCMPSKALLQSSEKYADARKHFASHGIKGDFELDLAEMMRRKDKVVSDLTKGVEFLLGKNKVDYVRGWGRIPAAGEVAVALLEGGEQSLKTANILVATGSESTPLAGVEVDERQIVSSTGALSFEEVPKHLVVIGAGVIGLELGSVWARLGAKVTVVEYLDRILPEIDDETAKLAKRVLAKQDLEFKLGMRVTSAKKDDAGVTLTMESVKKGEVEALDSSVVLVSIGRRARTRGLGLEELGVQMERGTVQVDGKFQTSVAGIYAIGDCVPGPMLAHKAEEDGVACVETLAGQRGHVNYELIPGVVYTHPEIATVGQSEEELKEAGIDYRVGKFPVSANSRARAMGESEGQVKILADAKTDRVLGVHIVAPMAGELLSEAVAVMEFGGSAEDIARTCHSHPGLSEAVKEAALAVDKRAIHV